MNYREWSKIWSPKKITNSKEIKLLSEPLPEKFNSFRTKARKQGIDVNVFSALRTLEKQGQMWCQSRSTDEVNNMRLWLLSARAPFLASFMREEWALCGKLVTKRLPGDSWHQWGEAFDFFAAVEGITTWYGSLYFRCANILQELELVPGDRGSLQADPFHVQMRVRSPKQVAGSWEKLDKLASEILAQD